MRYAELDVFGVYIAPIVPMLLVAWLILLPLRRMADHYGLLRHVWHPALFMFSIYLILLAVLVLGSGTWEG